MSDSKVWLEVMLKKHVRENTISRIVSIKLEPAVPKGENFASSIDRAKVTVIMGSGRTTTKSIIIKRLPEKELHTKFLKEYSLFKVETKVYADVLSEMEYMMLEYSDMDDKLWPDFLGHKAYDTIIFSDLKERNYSVIPRKEMLDKTHSFLAIRSLARYHAMTVLVYDRGLFNATDFEPYTFVSNTKGMNNIMRGGISTLASVMKADWGKEWSDVAKRIENVVQSCCDRLEQLRYTDESKFNVLNHGDFWTSNMMFKYSPCSGHDYPIGIRFVDFQMSHWNSYGFDLVYFLICAVQPELRREQLNKLLEAYHESLIATFKFYNYHSDKIPTVEEVKAEVDRLSFFAFMTMVSNFAVQYSHSENPLDFDRLLEGDDVIGHNPQIYKCEIYKCAVQQEFRKFIAKGVI